MSILMQRWSFRSDRCAYCASGVQHTEAEHYAAVEAFERHATERSG